MKVTPKTSQAKCCALVNTFPALRAVLFPPQRPTNTSKWYQSGVSIGPKFGEPRFAWKIALSQLNCPQLYCPQLDCLSTPPFTTSGTSWFLLGVLTVWNIVRLLPMARNHGELAGGLQASILASTRGNPCIMVPAGKSLQSLRTMHGAFPG